MFEAGPVHSLDGKDLLVLDRFGFCRLGRRLTALALGTDALKRRADVVGTLLEVGAETGDSVASGKRNGAADHHGGKHDLLHIYSLKAPHPRRPCVQFSPAATLAFEPRTP